MRAHEYCDRRIRRNKAVFMMYWMRPQDFIRDVNGDISKHKMFPYFRSTPRILWSTHVPGNIVHTVFFGGYGYGETQLNE